MAGLKEKFEKLEEELACTKERWNKCPEASLAEAQAEIEAREDHILHCKKI